MSISYKFTEVTKDLSLSGHRIDHDLVKNKKAIKSIICDICSKELAVNRNAKRHPYCSDIIMARRDLEYRRKDYVKKVKV